MPFVGGKWISRHTRHVAEPPDSPTEPTEGLITGEDYPEFTCGWCGKGFDCPEAMGDAAKATCPDCQEPTDVYLTPEPEHYTREDYLADEADARISSGE